MSVESKNIIVNRELEKKNQKRIRKRHQVIKRSIVNSKEGEKKKRKENDNKDNPQTSRKEEPWTKTKTKT